MTTSSVSSASRTRNVRRNRVDLLRSSLGTTRKTGRARCRAPSAQIRSCAASAIWGTRLWSFAHGEGGVCRCLRHLGAALNGGPTGNWLNSLTRAVWRLLLAAIGAWVALEIIEALWLPALV